MRDNRELLSEIKILDSLTIKLWSSPDYYRDASHLGRYTDKPPDEWYIDRKRGWLLGEYEEEPNEPDEPEAVEIIHNLTTWRGCGIRDGQVVEYNADLLEYSPEELARYKKENQEYEKAFDLYTETWDAWNDRRRCKLVEDLGRSRAWNYQAYRYYVPDEDHSLNDGREEFIKYIKQDYNRLEELELGHWGYISLEVEILINDRVESSDSLVGVESDMNGEDFQGTISNLIAEALEGMSLERILAEELWKCRK